MNFIQKWYISVPLLLVLLLISSAISLSTGDLSVSVFDIPSIIRSKTEGIEYTVLFDIRLPRIILAIGTGGALSVAGAILQGIYRNPLVEPYTLGISGGAAMGVAIAIVFGLNVVFGNSILPIAGFAGALLIIVLLYLLSLSQGRIKIQSMLLTGVMISFITSSCILLLMSITSKENLHGIIFWIMGSLDEPDTTMVFVVLYTSIAGLFVSFLFAQPLNALRLGEEKARHLGVNTDVVIRVLFVISSVLTGVSVAVAGVISFVGLVIPHLMRILFGTDYRKLLINSFLGGAVFLVLSDSIARTIIAPNELPIGVITGIIGGVTFVVLLARIGSKKI